MGCSALHGSCLLKVNMGGLLMYRIRHTQQSGGGKGGYSQHNQVCSPNSDPPATTLCNYTHWLSKHSTSTGLNNSVLDSKTKYSTLALFRSVYCSRVSTTMVIPPVERLPTRGPLVILFCEYIANILQCHMHCISLPGKTLTPALCTCSVLLK